MRSLERIAALPAKLLIPVHDIRPAAPAILSKSILPIANGAKIKSARPMRPGRDV